MAVILPGRFWFGRPGTLFLVLMALVPPGCERAPLPGQSPVLELEGETVPLEQGVSLVDVRLGPAPDPIAPDTVRVRPGDVVRFIASDARTYAVAFNAAALAPEAAAFLQRTNQLRGPPLITEGAIWVVSFKSAPPGAYPFTSLSQGVGGIVVVAAPPAGRR